MRKIISLLGLLLLSGSSMLADNYVVGNVTVPQGGTATLEIGLNNSTNECGGFEFVLVTDDGITASTPVRSSRVGEEFTLSGSTTGEGFKVLAYNTSASAITGTSGTIVSITLSADAGLSVGATLNGQLTSAYISDRGGESYNMDNVDFTITIGEPADPRTILDENSTTAPDASGGPVDVRVLRTIAAGNWSTICLPFAMTAEQVTAAFGNDVELADFTGVQTIEDGSNIVGLTVNFSEVTAIEANHPYIIKVNEAVSSFTVDGVDIDPEVEPSVDMDEYRTGSGTKKDPYVYHYNSFVGTYVANTCVPDLSLFLNGNKFYYSKGANLMKAFRGYFDFYDVLTEVENASVKMFVFVDDEETKVEGISAAEAEDTIYDLNGRKVLKPQHGVYIVNGKKVLK